VQILLVDDEHEGRSYLASYFALLGHDVTQCASAQEALAVLADIRFDLVISDVMMEGMSGLELTAALTASSRCPQPDIILYSGCVDDQFPAAATRAGVLAYLPKPIDFRALRQLLQQVADHRTAAAGD